MMSKEIIRLIQREIDAANDNLYRARAALYHSNRDKTKEWGQSGKTLEEIINGYEKTKQKYEQLLNEYKGE